MKFAVGALVVVLAMGFVATARGVPQQAQANDATRARVPAVPTQRWAPQAFSGFHDHGSS